MSKTLYILRSLPGGGKSTLAKLISETSRGRGESCTVHSTDDFHLKLIDGKLTYVFQPENLGRFHKSNQNNARASMEFDVDNVVIDNTNIKFSDFSEYIRFAKEFNYRVVLAEPNTPWRFNAEECSYRNTHNVPLEVCQKMLDRWETSYVIKLMIEDMGLRCEIL
jgi:2',3'-cyclic-nucleotide 3'-phosphodiesterase